METRWTLHFFYGGVGGGGGSGSGGGSVGGGGGDGGGGGGGGNGNDKCTFELRVTLTTAFCSLFFL